MSTRPFTGKTGLNLLPYSHEATGHTGPQHPYAGYDAVDPPREMKATCYNPPKGSSGGPPGQWRVSTDYFRWAWRVSEAILEGDVESYDKWGGTGWNPAGTAQTHTGNRHFAPLVYVTPGGTGFSDSTAFFLHSEVRIKARNRLKEENVNVAELLGDAPRTAKQVASLVKSGYNLSQTYLENKTQVLNLIRGGQGSAAFWSRKLSDLWLGYIYGIRPLINDVYSASILLRQQIAESEGKPPLLIASARTTRDESKGLIGGPSHDGGIEDIDFAHKAKYKAEAKYYAAIPTSWYYQADRFGVVNPYLVIWNATTLSFVIDWFYSVGAWLESLSAPMGLNIIGGYSCVRLDVTEAIIWTMPDRDWYNGRVRNGSTDTSFANFSVIERLADNNGGGLVLPYVKSPFSTRNVITSAALAIQRRKAKALE